MDTGVVFTFANNYSVINISTNFLLVPYALHVHPVETLVDYDSSLRSDNPDIVICRYRYKHKMFLNKDGILKKVAF